MQIKTRDDKDVFLRKLEFADHEKLCVYLSHLSDQTKKRFGPHSFERSALTEYYNDPQAPTGYICIDTETSDIVAYALIKIGFFEHDRERYESYGLHLNNLTDGYFAPSVADDWQGRGVGNELFHYILSDLQTSTLKRIFLWGGVQSDNQKAVRYYVRNGFKLLGQFEYHGSNDDMFLEIRE